MMSLVPTVTLNNIWADCTLVGKISFVGATAEIAEEMLAAF